MKRPILAAIIALVPCFIQAQDKQISIDKVGRFGLGVCALGDAGFILEVPEDKGVNIRRYSPQMDLLWEANASREDITVPMIYTQQAASTAYDFTENFTVAAPTGSWVYSLEMKPEALYKKTHQVTQIDKTGAVKKFTIEGREELGHTPQTVFCDDEYFYLLASDNGDEGHKKKKSEEKLVLNRFDAKTFAYKRIVLDLPAVAPDETTTFWTFLGQTREEKIMASKNIDFENNKAVYTIVTFNAEGKIIRTFTIEPKLENVFLRPALTVEAPVNTFHQVTRLDFTMRRPKDATYWVIVPTNGGYGNITFDATSESFYIFGLFGPRVMRMMASEYTGFYIQKYDKKGASLWKLQEPASAELLDEKYFRIHAMPGYRNISLKMLPDNSLNFSVHFKESIFTYAISPEGKVAHTLRKEEHLMPIDNLVLPAGAPLKSEEYLKNIKPKPKKKDNLFFTNMVSSKGEILFEFDPNGGLKLLFYKN